MSTVKAETKHTFISILTRKCLYLHTASKWPQIKTKWILIVFCTFMTFFYPNWSSVNFQGLYCAISVCMCVPQLTFMSVISCFHFWIPCMFWLCEKFSKKDNCNIIVTEFYFSQAAKIMSKKKSNYIVIISILCFHLITNIASALLIKIIISRLSPNGFVYLGLA